MAWPEHLGIGMIQFQQPSHMSFQLKIALTKMQEMFRKTVFPKINQLIHYTRHQNISIQNYTYNKCNMQLNDFQFYTIPKPDILCIQRQIKLVYTEFSALNIYNNVLVSSLQILNIQNKVTFI